MSKGFVRAAVAAFVALAWCGGTLHQASASAQTERGKYLVTIESLPPVKHQVAGPFGPSETPTVFVMTVLPGNVYAGLPKPGGKPPEK